MKLNWAQIDADGEIESRSLSTSRCTIPGGTEPAGAFSWTPWWTVWAGRGWSSLSGGSSHTATACSISTAADRHYPGEESTELLPTRET